MGDYPMISAVYASRQPLYPQHRLRHSLHPKHQLIINILQRGEVSWCNACHEKGEAFMYSCRECNFNLHRDCALQVGSCAITNNATHFQTFAYKRHPCNMNDGNYSSHNSNNMIYDTGNPTAVGSSLQTVIRHSLHPQHQLEYSNSGGKYGYYVYGCDACERKGEGFRYCCKECNFDLHKECALQVGSCTITSNTTHFQTVIRHSLHPQHQLEYSNRGGKHTYGYYYGCDACEMKGEGFRYCCKECNFDLHKECALQVGSCTITNNTTPTVIRHSLHPQHQLEYSNRGGKYRHYVYGCDACEMKGEGFRYCCKECNFDLHKECAAAVPVGSSSMTLQTSARKDKMTKYDDDIPYARIFKKAFIKGVEEQLQKEIKDEIKKHFHEDTIGDVVSDLFQGLFM